MPIDTLKISKNLEDATVPKMQADAIAEALLNVAAADLASKADIAQLELRMVKEISAVKDSVGAVKDRVNTILLAILGVGVLTWVLQIFGTVVRQFLHLP